MVVLLPVDPLESKNQDPQADVPAPVYVRLPCGMGGPLAAAAAKSKGEAAFFIASDVAHERQARSSERQNDSIRRKMLENKTRTWNEEPNGTVVQTHGFAQRNRKDKMMVQVAAALLFAIAAGLGITVILAMLRNNENAILSALAGEGAFPLESTLKPGPADKLVTLRRSPARRDAPRPVRSSLAARPVLSRAA